MTGALPVVAVVGATGVVGRELLGILAARGWPVDAVRALASPRSAGVRLAFGTATIEVAALGARPSFDGCGYVFGCADADTGRTLAGAVRDAGATLIDNSSAFRHADGVPLVIPEVNGHLLDGDLLGGDLLRGEPRPAIVANPNCSTILMLVALEPLRRRFGLRRLTVATYQAVSGAGAAALGELADQTRAVLDGGDAVPSVFAEPCAFNVFPHESAVDPATGHNGEERKMVAEARRILGDPALRVAPTCVRVPVRRAHTQAIEVELARAATAAEVAAAYTAAAPDCGIEVVDDRAAGLAPTALRASGGDRVLIGRLRPSAAARVDERGATTDHALFAAMDQLRKGAALNGVQILERLERRGPVAG